ncbi:hypothetical protein CR513_12686, partial [Mucuna pruriens]
MQMTTKESGKLERFKYVWESRSERCDFEKLSTSGLDYSNGRVLCPALAIKDVTLEEAWSGVKPLIDNF